MNSDAKNPGNIALPRWLTRVERASIRRIEGIRAEAEKPVLDAEVDALADYVFARSRVSDLRKMYKTALAELRAFPDTPSNVLAVLKIAAQIDTTSSAARRLGRQIGLGPNQT